MTKKMMAATAVVAFAGLFAPASAAALDLAPHAYAASSGISFNPDQFNAAFQVQLGTSWKPQIRPVVELGMGNGVRLLSVSGDVLYHFDGRRWIPYVGGGPGVNVIDVTNGVGEADGIKTKLVAHAVTGLSWIPRRGARRYFVEGRFGVGDTPDFRMTLGMSF